MNLTDSDIANNYYVRAETTAAAKPYVYLPVRLKTDRQIDKYFEIRGLNLEGNFGASGVYADGVPYSRIEVFGVGLRDGVRINDCFASEFWLTTSCPAGRFNQVFQAQVEASHFRLLNAHGGRLPLYFGQAVGGTANTPFATPDTTSFASMVNNSDDMFLDAMQVDDEAGGKTKYEAAVILGGGYSTFNKGLLMQSEAKPVVIASAGGRHNFFGTKFAYYFNPAPPSEVIHANPKNGTTGMETTGRVFLWGVNNDVLAAAGYTLTNDTTRVVVK